MMQPDERQLHEQASAAPGHQRALADGLITEASVTIAVMLVAAGQGCRPTSFT
jgi:hypothetical protein